jgi:hypothetical protein
MPYRFGAAPLVGYVEEEHVLAGNDVRDAVPVVGHRTEAAPGGYALGELAEIHPARLAVRRLRRGQPPRLAEHLLEEGRIHFQVLRHHVEAEEVAVDALAAHGVLVAHLNQARCSLRVGASTVAYLVSVTRLFQQLHALFGGGAAVVHGFHPPGGFYGARTHRLRASLSEQPGHAGLVGQAEPTGVSVIRQLERHLEVGVGAELAPLDEALAVVVVDVDTQVDVVDQTRHHLHALLDGLLALGFDVPVEADRSWRNDFRLANGVAVLVISTHAGTISIVTFQLGKTTNVHSQVHT